MTSPADGRRRILVVDDEAIVVSLVRDTLSDDYEVSIAHNGEDALRQIAESPCELLISDIRMPGMTGIELAKTAREKIPDLAIIFITGYADLNSAKDAIQQGAYDYIMKPFEIEEIRTAVHKALEKKSKADSHNSETQLKSLSTMNRLLFSAGDVTSLVGSTLRFTMMQQEADQGMALVSDREHHDFVRISIDGARQSETRLPAEPLTSVLSRVELPHWGDTTEIGDCLKHPVGVALAGAELLEAIGPEWRGSDQPVLFIPIKRPDRWYGWAVLGFKQTPQAITAANRKYLDIAASQLAISLENLALLRESQKAYSTLKELQEQTIELEKMATRGVMSAEIGHEMNNFLAVVAGNLSLLQLRIKKQNYDEIERFVTAISGTIDKMTVFTRNLMDLTPMSSQKVTTSFEKLLSEVLSYLKVQKRFKGVVIDAPPSFDAFPFDADPVQIQQLLYNLFNNAADAMKNSPKQRITVSLESSHEPGYFVFSISDTGPGFDPDFVAMAFQERFTTKPTGHGFGLVVCRRIIDNHGGKLELTSSPGSGAKISITFPHHSDADITDPNMTQEIPAAALV